MLCRSRQSAVAAFHGVNCPLWSIEQTRIRYSIVATPNEKSPFNHSTNQSTLSTVSRIPDQLGGRGSQTSPLSASGALSPPSSSPSSWPPRAASRTSPRTLNLTKIMVTAPQQPPSISHSMIQKLKYLQIKLICVFCLACPKGLARPTNRHGRGQIRIPSTG